jgi:hypothetical protein
MPGKRKDQKKSGTPEGVVTYYTSSASLTVKYISKSHGSNMMPSRRANPLHHSSGCEGFFEEIVSAALC